MPLRMHTVVVFGDSLSDIGKKWKTKSGKMARLENPMFVGPTGRFSDCRNWTDFIFEEASGPSMIVDTAKGTMLSVGHTSFTKARVERVPDPFQYANYAEGGACGDPPGGKALSWGRSRSRSMR